MILVKRKRLIISFLMILGSLVLFLLISIDSFSEAPLNISIEKQQVVYWGVVTILFQTLVFLSLFIDQRKLVSDLKKIASYKDLNHPQSAKILDQLDEIGQVIYSILNDFNKLLELRLNRITAFNKVLKIVCEEYPEPLLITDTMGSILGISQKLSDKLNLSIGSDLKINDIFPDLKLAEILVFLEKNREIWRGETNSAEICTPIFDKNGNLNLCIWEFEATHISQKIISNPVNNISKRTLNSFKGFLKRKGK
ncbi:MULTISPECIES: hypothetical protein [unclassified Oceanispirochaeta]|uniref:hypothetical protein n=1 Tax=unclassified Oceanispirochaeta TaxID=2635722 RepID=UPI000E094255|nr:MULTISPECIES: hypothetical protein [unclassified Oceanispirochaeta]MBF9016756.1 hypothetical protein [Oceanispirochaeta sp. M2]NPD72026.1 hypothetical protein [Oceanispirochaeta sp. M1]RDG32470.1 hypothetical protein DV872_07930 [Oceanispirochaeta sp. M1]